MGKCQLLCAFFLMILISKSYAISDSAIGRDKKESCHEHEYWNKNGFCCNKCHAGWKLIERCSGPEMRTKCEKCEEGTYLDTLNYSPSCFRCQECKKPNAKEKSPCKHDKDRICECDPGYYMNILGPLNWECSPCKECGQGQKKIKNCTQEANSVCKCIDKYYPVGVKCEPCVKCREGCEHLCLTSPPINPVRSPKTTTPPEILPQILVPVCACIMVLALGGFTVYESIKHWRKRQRALSSKSSSQSPVPEHQTLIITVPPDTVNESVPFTNNPCEIEPHKTLPDCVPREIKIHEFFYFVLEEVPVLRFKELIRRLGVSEQNIGWAEQDHRNFKDAQYQMLNVWSESGSAGGNNVLPYPRIQMFIDTLKDMNLQSCADNIENKFLSPHTVASQ